MKKGWEFNLPSEDRGTAAGLIGFCYRLREDRYEKSEY